MNTHPVRKDLLLFCGTQGGKFAVEYHCWICNPQRALHVPLYLCKHVSWWHSCKLQHLSSNRKCLTFPIRLNNISGCNRDSIRFPQCLKKQTLKRCLSSAKKAAVIKTALIFNNSFNMWRVKTHPSEPSSAPEGRASFLWTNNDFTLMEGNWNSWCWARTAQYLKVLLFDTSQHLGKAHIWLKCYLWCSLNLSRNINYILELFFDLQVKRLVSLKSRLPVSAASSWYKLKTRPRWSETTFTLMLKKDG